MKIKIQKANIISDLFMPILKTTAKNDPKRFYFRLFGYDIFVVRKRG